MRPTGRITERGFTLIEVLIAASLAALVLGALYSGFFTVLKGQRAIDDELERSREISRFLEAFSNEARSAFYSSGSKYTAFYGSTRMGKDGADLSSIAFTAFTHPVISESRRSGDLVAISYFVEEKDGKSVLYKEAWNPFAKRKEDAAFKAEVLEDILGFEVLYYNGSEWAKAWDAQKDNRLPHALKAVIKVPGQPQAKEFSSTARVMVR